MQRELNYKNWHLLFNEDHSGTYIRMQQEDETHIFQPSLAKHQQMYDLYKDCKAHEYTPLKLLEAIPSLRHEVFYKDHHVVQDFSTRMLRYLKIEVEDKKFETNGTELLMVCNSNFSNGTLSQNYHVRRKHAFPQEVDVLQWFKEPSSSKVFEAVDNFLKDFPAGTTLPSPEQPAPVEEQPAQ